MKILSLFLTILIYSGNLLFAGTLPPKNINIFDEFGKSAAESIAAQIDKGIIDSLIISTRPESISWLIENPLTRILKDKGIKIYAIDSTASIAVLSIDIRKAQVIYESDPEEDDNLLRRIELEVDGKISLNGVLIPLQIVTKSYNDKISREEINGVEDKNYNFTIADVPDRDDWFYKSILEPVIVIGTAAVAVILLFTVRSQ